MSRLSYCSPRKFKILVICLAGLAIMAAGLNASKREVQPEVQLSRGVKKLLNLDLTWRNQGRLAKTSRDKTCKIILISTGPKIPRPKGFELRLYETNWDLLRFGFHLSSFWSCVGSRRVRLFTFWSRPLLASEGLISCQSRPLLWVSPKNAPLWCDHSPSDCHCHRTPSPKNNLEL